MKKTLLFVLLAGALAMNAQNLDKVVTGGPFYAGYYTYPSKIKTCSDGGVLTCLLAYDSMSMVSNYTIVRTDAQLNQQWIRQISNSSYTIYDLGEIASGGYYIYVQDYNTSGYGIIKLDNSGNQLWAKAISVPASGAYSSPKIKINAAGEFIVIPSQYDYVGFMKLDANGNYLSGMCFKADSAEFKNPGFDGDPRDSSITLSGKAGSDNFIINSDYSGNVNWSVRYGNVNGGYHQPWVIKKANDGNFLISGYGYDMLTSAYATGFFMKIDAAGNILFMKNYSSSLFQITAISNFTELSNGEFILESGAGAAFWGSSAPTLYIKCDASGNPLMSYAVDITGGAFSLDNDKVTYIGTKVNGGSGQSEYSIHRSDFNFSNKCNFFDYYGTIGSNANTNFVTSMNTYYKFNMQANVTPLSIAFTTPSSVYNISDACMAIGISESASADNNAISLFPQPSNSNVTVQIASQSANGITAEVFSLDGKKVLSEKFNGVNSFQLSTSELSNGMYLLKVMDGNDVVGVKKLMVER